MSCLKRERLPGGPSHCCAIKTNTEVVGLDGPAESVFVPETSVFDPPQRSCTWIACITIGVCLCACPLGLGDGSCLFFSYLRQK